MNEIVLHQDPITPNLSLILILRPKSGSNIESIRRLRALRDLPERFTLCFILCVKKKKKKKNVKLHHLIKILKVIESLRLKKKVYP